MMSTLTSRSHTLFSLQVWEVNTFVDASREPCPSPIVALGDILAPVAQHDTVVQGRKVWLTMPLSRLVSVVHSYSNSKLTSSKPVKVM